ncbi:MAG TPA: cytochrome P460 family protein [Spirochaetia bacterium]|nr:cytochrome P460 family protein [Spirochaetia bacterium]
MSSARDRRRGGIVATAAFVAVLFASCEQALVEPDVEPIGAEEISGERLWSRITEEAPFESYSFWPGDEGVQPGQAPHGPFHRIFVNKALFDAVPIASQEAPDGTIIVKENLDTSQELTGYTVMAKVEGFAPESGDWYWARYLPDGTVAAAGAIESCIVCHAGMKRNDYIIVHQLDRGTGADGE